MFKQFEFLSSKQFQRINYKYTNSLITHRIYMIVKKIIFRIHTYFICDTATKSLILYLNFKFEFHVKNRFVSIYFSLRYVYISLY